MCGDCSRQHFVAWAKGRAIPLTTVEVGSGMDDLRPLKTIVNQARVVALGESGHGIHEFLTFRNRLLAFLVKEMDFTAIAVETGFSESLLVGDYVLGKNVDRDTATRSVFTWGDSVWKENQELIEWMRQYNARPTTSRRIRFYGLDLTGGVKGRLARCRRALDAFLPVELTREIAACCSTRFWFYPDKRLLREAITDRFPDAPRIELTALEVHNRFGGSVIEEVLEKGSARVRED